MPVDVLLVEGKLDAQMLGAVLQGAALVVPAGSKHELPHQARHRRAMGGEVACYLRDRDFDHEPPTDAVGPEVDRRTEDGSALGWRWCRHEIENYLIDPALAAPATGLTRDAYASELTAAARRIRHYEAARWVVGTVRRTLPPAYELRTRGREADGREFYLPDELSEHATSRWAREHISTHAERIADALAPATVEGELARRGTQLSDTVLASIDQALLWCSGKDLLAAMVPWLRDNGLGAPGGFLAAIRDWVIEHPGDAVAALPECQELLRILTASDP